MYQLGLTLAISCLTGKKSQTVFNVDRPVEKMVSNQGARIEPFPDLPLANLNNLFTPQILDQLQNDVIKKITINLAESQQIEKITPSITGARMVVSKKQEINSIQFWQSYKKKKTSQIGRAHV